MSYLVTNEVNFYAVSFKQDLLPTFLFTLFFDLFYKLKKNVFLNTVSAVRETEKFQGKNWSRN